MTLTKKQKAVFDYILSYRNEHGFSPTQDEIREFFGFRSLGSVQDYIRYLTKAGALKKVGQSARGLVPVEEQVESKVQVPLLGGVAAGSPLEILEEGDFIDVPDSMLGRGQYFALNVHGNSMIEDGILDGDIVIIEEAHQAENGQTVVASIGQEATIKRFYQKQGRIELHPANSSMEPIIVDGGDLSIRGRLVGLLRNYQ